MRRLAQPALAAVTAVLVTSVVLAAQAPGRGGRGADAPPSSPRAAAPVDFSGTWVSVVSEDWRWRMMTPARGDYTSVPMTPEARKVADAWNPARDEAAGEQCRSYAAPALMRIPGRLRISWQDDYTLKLETDAGMQTRLFQFQRPNGPRIASSGTTPRSWQGVSVARWEPQPTALTGGGFGGGVAAPPTTRSLEVNTTRIRRGYLRKNGVPFGEDATLTEYYDAWRDASGEWFTVTSVVRDPQYLRQPFVTTTHFKKEPNDAKWDPTPCRAR